MSLRRLILVVLLSIGGLNVLSDRADASLWRPELYTAKTQYGNCPEQFCRDLVSRLLTSFQSHGSLYQIKQEILQNDLKQKFFLSDYSVAQSFFKRELHFSFQCPSILGQLEILNPIGTQVETQYLLDQNGSVVELVYKEHLERDGKLTVRLPVIALHRQDYNPATLTLLRDYLVSMSLAYRPYLSEILYSPRHELTLIFSFKDRPMSVYLGHDEWPAKMKKLTKIIEFFRLQERYPSTVNLAHLKKVVVKFSDNF